MLQGRRAVQRIALSLAGLLGLLGGSGCSLAPKNFAQMVHPAPIVRARAAGLSEAQPDEVAIPVLIDRLGDTDPVVRLTAHETLRQRTGQDFGYLPWGDQAERASAQQRWKTWWGQQPHVGGDQNGIRGQAADAHSVRGQSAPLAVRRKGGLGRWRRFR